MEFVKISLPVDNAIRVKHCKNCQCDEDSEEQSLKNKVAQASGG